MIHRRRAVPTLEKSFELGAVVRLKQPGLGYDLVYDEPPVHMFEVGRFREESMAFPPGVTVKDYTWAGSAGYLNPKRGAEPARFRTIIQIVPAPAPPRPSRTWTRSG